MFLATVLAALMAVTGTVLPNPAEVGSLTVNRQTTDSDPVVGAEFSMQRITHDRYGNVIDLTTNIGWGRAAAVVMEEVFDLPADGHRTATTNASGTAAFTGLNLGLWLVFESDTPVGHVPSEPFVVTLPFTSPEGDGWLYDAVVYPKAAPLHSRISVEVAYYDWVEAGLGNYEDAPDNRDRDADTPATAVTVNGQIGAKSRVTNVGETALRVAVDKYTHLGAVEKTDLAWTFDGAALHTNADGYLFTDAALTNPVVLLPGQYVLGAAVLPAPAPAELHGSTVRARGTAVVTPEARTLAIAFDAAEIETITVSDVDWLYAIGGALPAAPPDLPVTGAQIAGLIVAASVLVGAGVIIVLARKRKDTADA